MRLTVDCKTRSHAYETWKMRMSERDKQTVHRARTVMDIPYLRGRSESNYLLMLDRIRCDLAEGLTMRSAVLAYRCLEAPYDTPTF